MHTRFRAENYFNQLLRSGWLFELDTLPEHPILNTLSDIRVQCDELATIQDMQLPIQGAFGTRLSAADVIAEYKNPYWAIGFCVVYAILQSFLSIVVSLPLSLSIVYGIAIFRVIQQDAKRRQNRRSLSELKEEEDRIRMDIINAAQALSESPFLAILPHRQILFQPIVLPPEQQRYWDEYMLKLAGDTKAPSFFGLSEEMSSS